MKNDMKLSFAVPGPGYVPLVPLHFMPTSPLLSFVKVHGDSTARLLLLQITKN